MPLGVGARLGDFEILDLIGSGGMGDVYRARQLSLDRLVAVKVLPPEFARDPRFTSRFEAEVKAAARVQHPNIVQVYAAGVSAGRPWYAMELVEGKDLALRLKAGEAFPVRRIAEIGRDVAQALDAAAEAGYLHRDIKPSNIMVDRRGRVRVMDFGLARAVDGGERLTQAGAVLGSPHYLSPEQGMGKPLDVRSDLYSLGVVLYELLVGRPPFDGESHVAIIYQHVNVPPPPIPVARPDAPPALVEAVLRLLAKDPAGRPTTAAEAAAIFDGVAHALDPGASVAPRTPVPEASPARHALALAGAALGVFLATGITSYGVGLAVRSGALDAAGPPAEHVAAVGQGGAPAASAGTGWSTPEEGSLPPGPAEPVQLAEPVPPPVLDTEAPASGEPATPDGPRPLEAGEGSTQAPTPVGAEPPAQPTPAAPEGAPATPPRPDEPSGGAPPPPPSPAGTEPPRPGPATPAGGGRERTPAPPRPADAAARLQRALAVLVSVGPQMTRDIETATAQIEEIARSGPMEDLLAGWQVPPLDNIYIFRVGSYAEAPAAARQALARHLFPRIEPELRRVVALSGAPGRAGAQDCLHRAEVLLAQGGGSPPPAEPPRTGAPSQAPPTMPPGGTTPAPTPKPPSPPPTELPGRPPAGGPAPAGSTPTSGLGPPPAGGTPTPGGAPGTPGTGWFGEPLPAGIRRSPTTNVYLLDAGQGLAIEMVYVVDGDFLMGSPQGEADEQPQHVHPMPRGFYIGRYEVTWREYAEFCTRTGRSLPERPGWHRSDAMPAVNVAWTDADAFCRFAGGRLPAEAEWEKAARGPSGLTFPWGEAAVSPDRAVFASGLGFGARTVGSCPDGVSPYGAFDLAGNVAEWCQDWYDALAYRRYAGRLVDPPATGSTRVVRGGTFTSGAPGCRSSDRGSGTPELWNENVGFRVAVGGGP